MTVGDYAQPDVLCRALEGVSEVVHLAWSTVPGSSYEEPLHDLLSNVPPTVRLFEESLKSGVERLVYVSTGGAIYGEPASLPLTEDSPTCPMSPYGTSKLAAERYAQMFHALKGLPVVVVRPGNAYGEGQRPFSGQGFVATAIGCVLSRREIPVFGERGTVRDYIHVSDVAEGIVAALDHCQPYGCFNIGTGIGRSNRDVIEALEPLAHADGLQVRVSTQEARPFDVSASVLDSTRLTAVSGWKPRVSFADGIRRTWEALRDAG